MSVTLNINGKQQTLAIEPRVTLLDTLRGLGLTGSKKAATTDNAEPVRYWWMDSEYTPVWRWQSQEGQADCHR